MLLTKKTWYCFLITKIDITNYDTKELVYYLDILSKHKHSSNQLKVASANKVFQKDNTNETYKSNKVSIYK